MIGFIKAWRATAQSWKAWTACGPFWIDYRAYLCGKVGVNDRRAHQVDKLTNTVQLGFHIVEIPTFRNFAFLTRWAVVQKFPGVIAGKKFIFSHLVSGLSHNPVLGDLFKL